jgi:hypothetical protein
MRKCADLKRKLKIKTKFRIALAAFLICISAFGVFLGSPGNFKASLFSSVGEDPDIEADVFVKQTYFAPPDEIGEIAVYSNAAFGNVVGFAFELFFNEKILTPIAAGVEGTQLADRGFLVEKNTDTAGRVRVLAAAAGDGISISSGDEIFRIKFRVESDAVLGKRSPLELVNFSIAQNDNGNLIEAFPVVSDGLLTVQNDRKFRVKSATATDSKNWEVEFSHNLVDADNPDTNYFKDKITVYDSSFDEISSPEISSATNSGDKITIEFTNANSSQIVYGVTFSDDIEGENDIGKLSPRHNFAIFRLHDKDITEIEKITVDSPNSILVEFSRMPSLFGENNFQIFGFDGSDFKKLGVLNTKKVGDAIQISTDEQEENALYFLAADEAKNAKSFTGFYEKVPEIISISPSEVFLGDSASFQIEGANLENATVRIDYNPLIEFPATGG